MFGKSDSHKNYPPNFLHDLYNGDIQAKLAGGIYEIAPGGLVEFTRPFLCIFDPIFIKSFPAVLLSSRDSWMLF